MGHWPTRHAAMGFCLTLKRHFLEQQITSAHIIGNKKFQLKNLFWHSLPLILFQGMLIVGTGLTRIKQCPSQVWFKIFLATMPKLTQTFFFKECPYSYGIFPLGEECSPDYVKCANGVAKSVSCEVGLVFDRTIRSCNYPDLLVEEVCHLRSYFCLTPTKSFSAGL